MRRFFNTLLIGAFFAFSIGPVPLMADEVVGFPTITVPVSASITVMVKGLSIHPENPLQFDFIIEPSSPVSSSKIGDPGIRDESLKMIKYFLASLTVPEQDMWVNLSPYEKNRIIPQSFGQTLMGRDLLGQDYVLKQMTSSLIHPDTQLGKVFWSKIYNQARAKFGTTEIPINTFNKVWIMPDKATVWEHGNHVFVVERHLKVMLEEDYLAMERNASSVIARSETTKQSNINKIASPPARNDADVFASQIIREIVIPALEKEVNEGESFAQLRQIYNCMILATWFKKRLKDSLLGTIYTDKGKVAGVKFKGSYDQHKIYTQYLEMFKKGAFNFIKEEPDPATGELIPRKYFSGGAVGLSAAQLHINSGSRAMLPSAQNNQLPSKYAFKCTFDLSPLRWPTAREAIQPQIPKITADAAMAPEADNSKGAQNESIDWPELPAFFPFLEKPEERFAALGMIFGVFVTHRYLKSAKAVEKLLDIYGKMTVKTEEDEIFKAALVHVLVRLDLQDPRVLAVVDDYLFIGTHPFRNWVMDALNNEQMVSLTFRRMNPKVWANIEATLIRSSKIIEMGINQSDEPSQRLALAQAENCLNLIHMMDNGALPDIPVGMKDKVEAVRSYLKGEEFRHYLDRIDVEKMKGRFSVLGSLMQHYPREIALEKLLSLYHKIIGSAKEDEHFKLVIALALIPLGLQDQRVLTIVDDHLTKPSRLMVIMALSNELEANLKSAEKDPVVFQKMEAVLARSQTIIEQEMDQHYDNPQLKYIFLRLANIWVNIIKAMDDGHLSQIPVTLSGKLEQMRMYLNTGNIRAELQDFPNIPAPPEESISTERLRHHVETVVKNERTEEDFKAFRKKIEGHAVPMADVFRKILEKNKRILMVSNMISSLLPYEQFVGVLDTLKTEGWNIKHIAVPLEESDKDLLQKFIDSKTDADEDGIIKESLNWGFGETDDLREFLRLLKNSGYKFMYYGRIGAEGYIGYLEDERRANKIKRQLDQDPDKLSKVIMLTNGYIAAKEHFYKQQRPWESMYALGQEMVNVFGPKQIGSVLILSNLNPFNPETSVLDTRLTKGFIVEDTALKDDPVTIFASLGENEVLLPSWSRAWDAAIFMGESPDGGGGDNVDVPPAPGPGVGKQITEEAFVSAAMLGNDQIKNARAVGGIDMNAQHLDLAIKRDTKGMPLAADHQNWAQLSIQGVEPRIKQIESVHLLELIGSEE